jgi:hypothetical protein
MVLKRNEKHNSARRDDVAVVKNCRNQDDLDTASVESIYSTVVQ